MGSLLLLVVLVFPSWRRGTPFYDDYSQGWSNRTGGLWGPLHYLHSLMGGWRIGGQLLISLAFEARGHLWVIRLLGVGLHVGAALLALYLWRRLGGSGAGGWMLFVAFVVYPFALEAINWPTNECLYPASLVVAVGGAALVASSPQRWPRCLVGGLLIGAAPLFHEQVLAVSGVLLVVLLLARARAKVLLAAAVVPLAVFLYTLTTVPANNPRWTSQNRPRLSNAITHLPFLWDRLRLITPLGWTRPARQLYWSTEGFHQSWTPVAVVIGVLLTALVVATTQRGDAVPPATRRRAGFATTSLVLSVVALVGVSVPVILPAAPWFTARVGYLPAFVSAWVLASVVELALLITPRRMGAAFVAVLTLAAAVWGSMALGAEARANGRQLYINHARLSAFVTSLDPVPLDARTVVVVAGYPYSDVARPLFGEHIITFAQVDLLIALAARRPTQSGLRVDARGEWTGLCLREGGLLTVTPDWIDGHPEIYLDHTDPVGRVIYAVWFEGRWQLQMAEHALTDQALLAQGVPRCAPGQANAAQSLVAAINS